MPTYSRSFPHEASDNTGWGLPQLKIAHDDGSLSVVTIPTAPDDPGPVAWQEAPAEVRGWDWSFRPQPAADALADAREGALSRLNTWWRTQGEAGVQVGGRWIPCDTAYATALGVQLSQLQPGQDMTVYDRYGLPHTIAAADIPTYAVTYKTSYDQRRALWDTARLAIEQAQTIDALTALPGSAISAG
jgi:hypothetical protein